MEKVLSTIFILLLIRFFWVYWVRPLFVDEEEERQQRRQRQYRNAAAARQRFITILMALIARIAKADGRITESEIAYVERLFHEYALSEEECAMAKASFIAAKDDPNAFEDALARFNVSRFSFEVRFATFSTLIGVARIDGGKISSAKRELLWRAAAVFGLPRPLVEHLLGETTYYSYYQRQSSSSSSSSSASSALTRERDLELLGLGPSATAADIKRAYRQKVKELHPDRLQAQGLPASMIGEATTRMSAINAAYARLTR